MKHAPPQNRLARYWAKLIELGPRGSLRQFLLSRLADPRSSLPLGRANPAGLFATNVTALHEQEKRNIRASSMLVDASSVENSYPLQFEWQGRILRYAYLPSKGKSRGLAVLFHGHNAFLHLGPMRPWQHFDLLAPWDTFGWQRQGSWFWGEHGSSFVEEAVQALITHYHQPGCPWFCTGASMGGFGSLWHGIKYNCDGIYVQCPQVDLALKVRDYGEDFQNNPYAFLFGTNGTDPDLLSLAGKTDRLPPLYLIQNQFDHVNPFSLHAWRLLEIYNSKRAWYGLRIYPSIGHGGDGKQEEAELFFEQILNKRQLPSFELVNDGS